jgi:hypothetical protein
MNVRHRKAIGFQHLSPGIELYRKLSHMAGVWLNVLFISAYSVAKPFDSSVFLDRVRSLIERPITFRLAS